MVLCLFFGSSFTFANSLNNEFQAISAADTTSTPAVTTPTLPQLNQSSDYSRTYNFTSGETVTLDENMGITSSGVFTINGTGTESNSIIFNSFSGFVVNRIQTTLNINNVTITGAESSIGSAIYNTASDAVITLNNVNFTSNSTLSQSDALGGAIFSRGRLTLTNTSFTGNSAVSGSSGTTAKGGAIYALNSVQMVADSDNVVIVDNYTQVNGEEKNDNAIYIDNSSATLNLQAVNSGSFAISDNIDGTSGYKVVMNGDGTGRIGIFNSIYNAEISVSNVDISFANGIVSNHELNNLTIGSNVNFIIDVDLANGVSDSLTAANSNGVVNISEICVISSPIENSVKVQVLKNSDNLTLNIDKLSSKLETTLKSTMYNDSVLADSIELGTTDTADDSIIITGWKDVLYEMVHDSTPSHMLKNFIFRTNTEYVLTQDLGEMPQESILSIYNTSGADYGVINANGHSMFKLINPITTVALRDIVIKNAHTTENGSVVYLGNNTASFSTENSIITNNSADGDGGAIYVKNGTLSMNNSTVSQNTSQGDGGAVYVTDDAQVEFVNVDFTSNSSEGNGGAIYTNTNITVSANNGSSTFEGNTANGESNAIYVGSSDAVLTLDARNNGSINMNDKISGTDEGYKINITGNSSGNVNMNNTVSNADITLSGSTLNLAKDDLLQGNSFNARGGTLNLVNGEIGETGFSSFSSSGKTSVAVDVDLANKSMDRITADSYKNVNGTINVTKMNMLSDAKSSTTKVQFAEGSLKSHVKTPINLVSYSRVYKYLVSYSPSDGYFTFSRGDGSDASSYNPAILPTGIAQQVAYMNQLQNYQAAMYHSDTYMMLPKKTRITSSDAGELFADSDDSDTASFIEKSLAIPEEIKSIWVRPYASFENIPLKHGPKVSSINYGTIFGGDSDMIELGHGFKAVYGGYVGYNGNSTSFMGVDTTQQGAVIGATGNIYKGNFFNTITANVGWMISENYTEYGTDTINLIMSGFANRMGYNIELRFGKYIIQPSLLMGYTFVHSSDYTTSNDVVIKSEPLHVMHFAPTMKFVANLENGWQPYACIMIMCNFIDKTNFTANTIRLPEMSIDPYVEYGLGIQKRWNDKYSGFAQATVRNGGRRGVSLLFGFRYMIGKIISREHFIVRENIGKKKAMFKERKEPEIEIGTINAKDKNKTKPASPVAEAKEKRKLNLGIIDGIKNVTRKIFFRYDTDVSAKVVTDVYPDGVIMTTLKGMKNNTNNAVDFKDKDLIDKKLHTDKHKNQDKIKQEYKKDEVPKQIKQKPVKQTQPEQKTIKQPAQQTETETIQTDKKEIKQAQTEQKTIPQTQPIQKSAQQNPDEKKSAEQKPIQPAVLKQENTTPQATVIKTPQKHIDIKPLNKVNNKKKLYLNQNRYIKPVAVKSYNDYEVEVVDIEF